MPKKITLQSLEKNLVVFNKIYDAVRIVDPKGKQILMQRENDVYETDETCYGFWNCGSICDNCISIRAHNENKSYVKLELGQDSIYMVMAIPVESEGRSIVVELLKNSTDSFLLATLEVSRNQCLRL
jgi:two-component system cell cycle response regulator